MSRLPVKKTYKLYVGGAFPRSESGRTYEVEGANVALASRKDVRDAVRAARGAFPKWAGMTAYNRGQVLYRVAEMMEGRRAEFAELTGDEAEVERGHRSLGLVRGLGRQARAGARLVQPGRRAVLQLHRAGADRDRRDRRARGAARSPASSRASRRPWSAGTWPSCSPPSTVRCAAVTLAEVLATSDVPGGVVNLLTGRKRELAPVLAGHMDVNALDLAGAEEDMAELERLAADNVKRIARNGDGQSPWHAAAYLELKTVWHPIGV